MAELTHVKGLADLQKLLDTLPAKIEKNIMRGALAAGVKVVKGEAQTQLASHGNIKTGTLSKGLKISSGTKGGKVIASLKAKGKHGFIAYWLEYTGAKVHDIKARKKKAIFISALGVNRMYAHHPGIKAKPFMRPALDAKTQEALVAVGEYVKKRLTKEGIDTADINIEAEQ